MCSRIFLTAVFLFFFNFYFYCILLYNTVLVLPYIDLNPPRVELEFLSFPDICPGVGLPECTVILLPSYSAWHFLFPMHFLLNVLCLLFIVCLLLLDYNLFQSRDPWPFYSTDISHNTSAHTSLEQCLAPRRPALNGVEEMEAVFKSREPLSHICDTVWRGRLMGAGGLGEGSLQWKRISGLQGYCGTPEGQLFGAAP